LLIPPFSLAYRSLGLAFRIFQIPFISFYVNCLFFQSLTAYSLCFRSSDSYNMCLIWLCKKNLKKWFVKKGRSQGSNPWPLPLTSQHQTQHWSLVQIALGSFLVDPSPFNSFISFVVWTYFTYQLLECLFFAYFELCPSFLFFF
jgi:hypothetical protein